MRISAITGSLVLHSALIAAAFTLPPPKTKRASDPVTIDLFAAKKKEAPVVAPTPLPSPPVAVARPQPTRERHEEPIERALIQPHPTPSEPVPTPAEPSRPEAVKPPGKVDLNLHALPGGSDNAVSVPSGTGTFGTAPGTDGGRKPWRMRGDAGNPIFGKIADEKEDRFPLRAVGGGELEYKGKAFSARIARDGRVSFDDKSLRDFKGLSGGFDITDMMMRAKGDDPYRAEKNAFMKETEAVRKKMAQAALKERMQASLARLPSMLDEVWRDTSRPVAERKKLLYEMWKDAAMSEGEVGDSAKEATAIIETYVRRYLPTGSEVAYSDDELDRLNHGQRHKFLPYR